MRIFSCPRRRLEEEALKDDHILTGIETIGCLLNAQITFMGERTFLLKSMVSGNVNVSRSDRGSNQL